MINYIIKEKNFKNLDYAEDLYELMKKINANNSAPLLYPPDREFFDKILGNGFLSIIALDEDNIVGLTVVKYLTKWPSYMGNMDIDYKKSAILLFVIVDEDYRGKSIASSMYKKALEEIEKDSFIENVVLTAHPDNIGSIKLAEKVGFKIVETRDMFEEKLTRHLMIKKI